MRESRRQTQTNSAKPIYWAVDPRSIPSGTEGPEKTVPVGQSVTSEQLALSLADFKTASSVTEVDGGSEKPRLTLTFALVKLQIRNTGETVQLHPAEGDIEILNRGEDAALGSIDSDFETNGRAHSAFLTYSEEVADTRWQLGLLPPGGTMKGWTAFEIPEEFDRSKLDIRLTRWWLPGDNLQFRWVLND